MKSIKMLLTNVCVLLIGILACSFPRRTLPTLEFPTPNLTATEIIKDIAITPEGTELFPLSSVTFAVTRTPIESPTGIITNTPEPTIVPELHREVVMQAVFLESTPSIDGDFREWNSQSYSVNHLVYGQPNYQGVEDLSATVALGWDETYLYFAIDVIDDVYVQNASGDQIFKGDSVEVILDVNLLHDFYETQLDNDDYQLGLSLGAISSEGSVKDENYLWFPRQIEGPKTGVLIDGVRDENGYRMEAAIPWIVFDIRPNPGLRTGFSISVSDNDTLSENVQESMVSGVSTRQLTDPTSWGELQLIRP